MFRALLRLIVVLVVVAVAAGFFLGYWDSSWLHRSRGPADTIGTGGRISAEKAREVGAAVGQKTADAATKAGEILSDSALTAKIKSKMALDDSVEARSIDVTTDDHVVTLSGLVRSVAEHDRAMQLARETNGVTRVVDKLTVKP